MDWHEFLKETKENFEKFYSELKKISQTHPLSCHVSKYFLHKGFPVDTRHNIKIRREILQKWCQQHTKLEFCYE